MAGAVQALHPVVIERLELPAEAVCRYLIGHLIDQMAGLVAQNSIEVRWRKPGGNVYAERRPVDGREAGCPNPATR